MHDDDDDDFDGIDIDESFLEEDEVWEGDWGYLDGDHDEEDY